MEDLNIVIAGEAGEGIQTIGEVLTAALSKQGYAVFSWKEYESRIRGGQNSYSIRVGEKPLNSPVVKADILLALNKGAVKKYTPILKESGLLMAQESDDESTMTVPFTKIAREDFDNKIYANTIACGALAAALGMKLSALTDVLDQRFSKKSEDIQKSNRKAAEKGYELGEKHCRDSCPWELPYLDEKYYVMTVNESLPLAAAYAGCRFISAYPMTPSTGVITWLTKNKERLKIFTEQAEDEIAAINMAIGAGFAGARAMTTTSGGGFALMAEGISMAGMTETPVVIVLSQRPGPATGLPTRTSQGDLLFAIFAGHGEFPKAVLAPSDPRDAFHKTVKAFNLADKYQSPVIILTDQFLSDSHFSIKDFDMDRIQPEFYIGEPSEFEEYKRYEITESGISPRLYPGQSSHLVGADSDEHDEKGHITEDLEDMAPAMAKKRLKKEEGLKKEIAKPEEIDIEDSDIIFVGWGSTRGAIHEAMGLLKEKNVKAGMIHFTEIWPLADYRFPEGKKFVSVENNGTSQFARLLKTEYSIHFEKNVNRIDGLPLTAKYIEEVF